MKVFFVSLFLCFLSACAFFKPGCVVEQQAEVIISGAIVARLQCTNPAAVQASVRASLQKLNLCASHGWAKAAEADVQKIVEGE